MTVSIIGAAGNLLPAVGGNTQAFVASATTATNIEGANRKVGASAVRLGINWADVELTQSVYTADAVADGKIAACLSAGRQVVVCLNGGNPFYTGSWATLPSKSSDYIGFANFCAWAAAYYKGLGIIWEIDNEPNNNGMSPQVYGSLLAATVPAMLAKDPSALVVSAGVGGCDGQWGDPAAFMQAVSTAVGSPLMAKLWAQAIHPYPALINGSADVPETTIATLASRFSQASPIPSRLIVTETGVASSWIGGDETKRAIWLVRAVVACIAVGVPVVTFYTLFDTGQDGSNGGTGAVNDQFHFGVFGFDKVTSKPAVSALAAFMSALSGTLTFDLIQSGPSGTLWALTLYKADGKTIVAFTTSGVATDFQPSIVSAGPVLDILGHRQWIAPLANGITEVTLPASGVPIIINGA